VKHSYCQGTAFIICFLIISPFVGLLARRIKRRNLGKKKWALSPPAVVLPLVMPLRAAKQGFIAVLSKHSVRRSVQGAESNTMNIFDDASPEILSS
jgi:hypothetical protein